MPYQTMTPYVPANDFSADEAALLSGRSTVRTAGVDEEFAALQSLTDKIINNLLLIQRADGFLEDRIVKVFNLAPSVVALMGDITPKGPWVTATSYSIKDVVSEAGATYLCAEAHVAGVFATDLAAGKWLSLTSSLTASEVKTLYESNADTNEFSDAEQTKLDGIESGATADQTNAEIKTAYEANLDTNAFTDALLSKLNELTSANAIINGDFRIAQRGASFTAATTPANNDDTYTLDRWILLSDGNDIVDVTQAADVPTGALNSIGLDVETIQKKFGILTVLEQRDSVGMIGGVASLSFKARVTDITKLDNIKAAVLSWDGTADTVTSDVVSAWNAADTTPTFAANWTAENTPANLSVTASWATYKIENIAIDTPSPNNIAVFIWSDAVADNDTLGTFLHVTDVKLEHGPFATPYRHRPYGLELSLAQRYAWVMQAIAVGDDFVFGQAYTTTQLFGPLQWPVEMRVPPTASFSATTDFNVNQANNTRTVCSNIALASVTKWNAALVGTVGSAVLTPGNASGIFAANTNAKITLDAEL